MKTDLQKIICFLTIISLLSFVSCQQKVSNYEKIEPAHLEHLDNSELTKLTLTEKAVERIGVLTTSVESEAATESGGEDKQLIVPYGAILYDAHGHNWVYTNPEPLVFLRHEVKINQIKDNQVYLAEGPPAGTKVVTQGAAELYGTEYEVGH